MPNDRVLLRAGFLLVLIAMAGGLAIQSFPNPQMGVAAHVTGLLDGLLLVAVGLAWPALRFSAGRGKLVRGLFLYAAYAAWGGAVLGAVWGTSRLTPIGGAGFHASPAKELLVQVILVSQAAAHIVGLVFVVLALFRRADASAG
ncbi:MAG TPA: hydroxylaminobenzene mutase [Thermoanaerobaculia bacterium]|jgi:hydroxylaminobenzene mutase|nr:hydroxylaminobenzene mutase [Thermoanaerobaculia bacterium]